MADEPDLNASRSPLDKKLYKYLELPNGLQCVLVSDTDAMHAHYDMEEEDDNDHMDSGSDDDTDHDDWDRDASICILVGAGSAHDPTMIHGLAHFLEHLLFMGSSQFPGENEYSEYVAKHSGTENAFTEWEYTVYSLKLPVPYLWGGVERLSGFFLEPLLHVNSVERELQSIQSEFALTKLSDTSRKQQLLVNSFKDNHPFRKFSWGNIFSIQEWPERNHINVRDQLWTFYNTHYHASNMRLVVQAGLPLTELQEKIQLYFGEVPQGPRQGVAAPTPLKETAGPPLVHTLATLTRIVAVKDIHQLSITWQLPSMIPFWKDKPADFCAHLLGHEGSGSLLSHCKCQDYATACCAGMGEEGAEHASTHTLFSISFRLSEHGLEHWKDIVCLVYAYIGMLRHYCQVGFPEYIFQELQQIADVSYQFKDEESVGSFTEELVEEMAPYKELPPERLLDGSHKMFEFNPDHVKDVIDCLTPENARIDLLSSIFGKPSDFPSVDTPSEPVSVVEVGEDDPFASKPTGDPQLDPMFGTQYWCSRLPSCWIAELGEASKPRQPDMFSLPIPNPYVPHSFDLKPFPENDADHPLLTASLRVCIPVGKKTKHWFPASFVRYNRKTNSALLHFEDGEEKWYTLDDSLDTMEEQEEEGKHHSFEGTMETKTIRYRVLGIGGARMYGDESDFDVEEGKAFPSIPPPSTQLPVEISNSNVLKMWWLHDRHFKRPIAELRLQIICATANSSVLHRVAADLFRLLCTDALTETSYMAEMCELGSSISATDIGFEMRIHGFDDKLLDLFQTFASTLLSFRGRSESLPDCIEEGRFKACKENLERCLSNDICPARLSSSVRLMAVCPTIHSANKKLRALKAMTIPVFCETVCSLLSQFAVEAFYHGNVDRKGANEAKKVILEILGSDGGAGLARKRYPPQPMLRIPEAVQPQWVVVPSKNPEEPNTVCDVYFQVAKDNLRDRVLVEFLMHIMEEPIYDQIRTKDQFGYDVYCDQRWSYGIIGCIFHVTTNVKSASEVVVRVDKFLTEFRNELATMKKEEFYKYLVALALHKLNTYDSLPDENATLWGEICDGRFHWEAWRDEVICLKGIKQQELLEAFDKWLMPGNRRNAVVIQVIGATESVSEGRPKVEASEHGDFVDDRVVDFHKQCKKQTWGRVNSKLFG